MRYPEFLKEKGTIGCVAPSFGASIEPYKSQFDNAVKTLKGKGFKMDLGPNCYKGEGIGISSTPENCGRELTEYYCSKENDILLAVGGGELMCRDLEHIDFEAIKTAEPKWYMGYSDNTNFEFMLATMCDVASVYGVHASSFGMEPWHKCIQDSLDVLMGKKLTLNGYEMYEVEGLKDEEHPTAPFNCTEPNVYTCYPKDDVQMQGRLLGGCLDILIMHCGTKYDHVAEFNERYSEDGVIWFMEACDLNVLAIERALWQLDAAGWFKNAKGFMFGRPLNGEELFGLDKHKAVLDILGKYNVPIIMDADFGHIPPEMPLIVGSYADVSCVDNKMTVKMELK